MSGIVLSDRGPRLPPSQALLPTFFSPRFISSLVPLERPPRLSLSENWAKCLMKKCPVNGVGFQLTGLLIPSQRKVVPGDKNFAQFSGEHPWGASWGDRGKGLGESPEEGLADNGAELVWRAPACHNARRANESGRVHDGG